MKVDNTTLVFVNMSGVASLLTLIDTLSMKCCNPNNPLLLIQQSYISPYMLAGCEFNTSEKSEGQHR